MILPNDERCQEIIRALKDDPELTEWENKFINSCFHFTKFSDKQKHVLADIAEKFDV